VPYPRIPLNDVVEHVENGYQMEAPEGCPAQVFNIMKDAWNLDEDKRPTFVKARDSLEKFKIQNPQ
jgi:c-src tyrosine kinase